MAFRTSSLSKLSLPLSLPLILSLLIALSLPSPSLSHEGHGAMHGAVELDRIVDNLTEAGNYTTLLSYLNNTVYATALNLTDGKNKTIFAPTDAAFAALPNATKALLNNSGVVFQILAYHIVSQYADQSMILATGISTSALELPQSSLPTLQGISLTVTINGTKIEVQNASVVAPSLLADNYTAVHGISGVLLPSNLNLTGTIPVYPSVMLMSTSPPPPFIHNHSSGVQIGVSSFLIFFGIWVSVFGIAM